MPSSEFRAANPAVLSGRAPRPPVLMAFLPVRWEGLTRRPQQLLSRLAAEFRVIVVEPPLEQRGTALLLRSGAAPEVEVLTPRLPGEPGSLDEAVLAALLAEFCAMERILEPIAWLATPMALPLALELEPRAIVYDCADDFASRPDAPATLVAREQALLSQADLVLTASPSLHFALQALHPNVHLVPAGVDAPHFTRLSDRRLECAAARALHEGLAAPRLGFFGAIDDRLDFELLDEITARRPHWSLVLVGPAADPGVLGRLPYRQNVRWLGPQTHDMLPYLLSQWDVALVPLAKGATTRFASPAQVLEYLAGGKPVVSTAIEDVRVLHGPAVRLAADAAGFIAAVEAALAQPRAQREAWRACAQALVEAGSWDDRAGRVAALVRDVLPGVSVESKGTVKAHATLEVPGWVAA